MDRNAFLQNLKQQLPHSSLPDAPANIPPGPTPAPFSAADLIEAFSTEAINLKSTVTVVDNDAAAITQLYAIFNQVKTATYLAWDEAHLPIADFTAQLTKLGLQRQTANIPPDAGRQAATSALDPVAIGITGADAALADTGTLVLSAQAGRGRLVSLAPPIHVALVRTSQLYPTMAHFVQAHPNALKQTSNLVFISGPSRTADIEQTLTLGVHGPKDLHIILLRDV